MAYIKIETAKEIRKAIKEAFPAYKFSVTVENYSSLNISLMAADFQIEKTYEQLNPFYLDNYSEKISAIFEKVKNIMFEKAPYRNNSDSMTDYFDVSYYYNFNIGKWNKPYSAK